MSNLSAWLSRIEERVRAAMTSNRANNGVWDLDDADVRSFHANAPTDLALALEIIKVQAEALEKGCERHIAEECLARVETLIGESK